MQKLNFKKGKRTGVLFTSCDIFTFFPGSNPSLFLGFRLQKHIMATTHAMSNGIAAHGINMNSHGVPFAVSKYKTS